MINFCTPKFLFKVLHFVRLINQDNLKINLLTPGLKWLEEVGSHTNKAHHCAFLSVKAISKMWFGKKSTRPFSRFWGHFRGHWSQNFIIFMNFHLEFCSFLVSIIVGRIFSKITFLESVASTAQMYFGCWLTFEGSIVDMHYIIGIIY